MTCEELSVENVMKVNYKNKYIENVSLIGKMSGETR